ncbi:MAG: hypothetical protein LBM25_00645 [Bacteroidales bacterium]|jgi:hypothetical protein|nr:hypothetical protein [Bacteroidales bacterium]
MQKSIWQTLLMSLLIIAMFILQHSSELEIYKYWICFVVVIFALCVITLNAFKDNKTIHKANKQLLEKEKTIEELNEKLNKTN